MKIKSIYFCLAVLLLLLGCSAKQQVVNPWDRFVEVFIDQYFAFHPDSAVSAGRHEFDGRLSAYTRESFDQEIAWLKKTRGEAEGFGDLSAAAEIERKHLLWKIDTDLFWLERVERHFKDPLFYSMNPSVYLTRNYAPLEERMKAFTAYAREVPRVVGLMKGNLRTPLPKPQTEVAIGVYKGYESYFQNDVPALFASIKDEKLQAEFKKANDAAARAAGDLAKWFETQLLTADARYSMGEERFREMLLKNELVDLSIDELERIGRADLLRNQDSLKKACEKFLPGARIEECTQKFELNKPDGGPVEFAKKLLPDLKIFIVEKDIVTIPSDEEATVAEAPAYRRTNSAYIEIPGPYEKRVPAIYYIAPPDPNWSKEDQLRYIPSRGDLLFTSAHEVWPGHFLERLHTKKSPNRIGRLFRSYAFSEGWAHYTEEMMKEQGLAASDIDGEIGQLLDALTRNARYLSAIGLHTRGMSIEESERLFRESAFKDPGTARQQARRGTYDALYLNYTLGKLMIMKLRKDWLAANPGNSLHDFHDAFLSYGGLPIPLIREMMLKQEGRAGIL